MPDEHKRRLAGSPPSAGWRVIGDDLYGDITPFRRTRPWPIKGFRRVAGNVMLCSSFSKSLSPALRIGFVAAGRYRPQIALQRP